MQGRAAAWHAADTPAPWPRTLHLTTPLPRTKRALQARPACTPPVRPPVRCAGRRTQVVLPDGKEGTRDIVAFLGSEHAAPSEEEAGQRGAVAALQRVAGERSLHRVLPQRYRELWQALGAQARGPPQGGARAYALQALHRACCPAAQGAVSRMLRSLAHRQRSRRRRRRSAPRGRRARRRPRRRGASASARAPRPRRAARPPSSS